MRSRPLPSFFVAEDDPNDMFLLTRLLKGCGAANPLHLALNGQEAVELLGRIAEGNGLMNLPSIVFLDIRMPRFDGLDVLAWVRARSAFASVPIVILSGADDPHDVERALGLGAQCFLKKYPSAMVMAEVLAAAGHFSERPEQRIFELPANLLCPRARMSDPGSGGRAPLVRS